MKSWIIHDEVPEEIKNNLSEHSPLIQSLLYNRGITDKKDADIFLHPDYERDLNDPFLILNMERAVLRILDAIKKEEKIIIYADYDADGIPGSVVLHDFFAKIKYEPFEVYIPHRYKEGYGLNKKAIEEFAKRGVSLIITVDSGITDVDEVKLANTLGVDVIVTDHHLPLDELPPAYAIVNPNQKGCSYPFPGLCGGGLAFKLVQALIQKGDFDLEKGWEKWLLDVAGISTISDMVPLTGENRAIATFGLKVLKKTKRPGLLDLFQKRRVNTQHLNEEDVGFVIAPRINAASRLDVPMTAFRFLSTRDEAEAIEIGKHLERKNNERKRVVAKIVEEIEEELPTADAELVVIGNTAWQPGILGLAATRIVEATRKPAFVWGKEGSDIVRGSCRSDGAVNMVELMGNVEKGYFEDFGGHFMSGGFSFLPEKVGDIEKVLLKALSKMDVEEKKEEVLSIDQRIELKDVNWTFFNAMDTLAPFGIDNPRPLFLIENVEIHELSHFGQKDVHLRISFNREGGYALQGINFFGRGDIDDRALKVGKLVDIAAYVEKDTFGRYPRLRLRIEALRSAL